MGDSTATNLTVKADPRSDYDLVAMKARQEKIEVMIEKIKILNESIKRFRDCEGTYGMVKKLAGKDAGEDFMEISKSTKTAMDELSKNLFRDQDVQGLYFPPEAFYIKISGVYSIIMGGSPMTPNEQVSYDKLMTLIKSTNLKIDSFLDTDWTNFREMVEKEGISLFKE